MKRRDFLKVSAGLGAASVLPSFTPAHAQAKMVLKASDEQPPGYPKLAAT